MTSCSPNVFNYSYTLLQCCVVTCQGMAVSLPLLLTRNACPIYVSY